MFRIELARGQMTMIVVSKEQARTLDMLETNVFSSVDGACEAVNLATAAELKGISVTFKVKDLGQLNGRKGRCS